MEWLKEPQSAISSGLVSLGASSSQASSAPARPKQDALVRDIRIYTMGVLSLPPLAKLLEDFVQMTCLELDDLQAPITDGRPAVSGGQTDVASSVQSVGRLFSSLFGSSVLEISENEAPPPLTYYKEHASAEVKSYWGEGEKKQAPTSGAALVHMVVARKAKVRDGVEISSSDSLAPAALVGTLAVGVEVVVIETAISKDGTPRSKVRTLLDGSSSSSRLLTGWVTTKLLRPFQPEDQEEAPAALGDDRQPGEEVGQGRKTLGESSLGSQRLAEAEEPSASDTHEGRDGPVHRMMERIQDFMAQTAFLVKEACEHDLFAIIATHSTRPLLADECEGLVDGAVWRQVEAELFIPLQSRLLGAVRREVSAEAKRVAQRLRSLKALPQSFWSIPDEKVSPSSWALAVSHLNAIPEATVPSDKVDILLKAVKAIERLTETERERAPRDEDMPSEASPLGADDLFPIFVYVLVQSELWKGGEIVVLREILSALANPERQRWSASAYYVATLEAAIEHIKAT